MLRGERPTQELFNLARPDIYRRLDFDSYEPRIATLTPAERDVLLATAACRYPPLAVAELNDAINKSPGNINVLLGRLVETGACDSTPVCRLTSREPRSVRRAARRFGGPPRDGVRPR